MKFKKITSALAALAVVTGALPFYGTILPNYSIEASAADDWYTYENFFYTICEDHIQIEYCGNFSDNIDIPDEIEGLPVTTIAENAFVGNDSAASITFPDSLTTIENRALDNTQWYKNQDYGVVYAGKVVYSYKGSLTEESSEIVLRDDTIAIADAAFSDCYTLKSIIMPDGLKIIGKKAFFQCTSMENAVIPDSVTSIGVSAFDGCFLLSAIHIPENIEYIGSSAFCLTGIQSAVIPASVKSIGKNAFASCSDLTSVTIKNPECEIYDDQGTFSDDIENSTFKFSGTIYGYESSTAQAYAEKYGRNFVSLGEAPAEVLYGDADGDGSLGISDVVKVMMYASDRNTYPMTEKELDAADVSNRGDGVFVSDALSIQKKLAQVIDTLPESFME